MEREGDHGPDAASIKPVSSLRAKFEGLQGANIRKAEPSSFRNSPVALKPDSSGSQSPLTRISLDLPRPQSPWIQTSNDTSYGPQTPDPIRKRSESPTKSGHKRPMSMLIQSSPKLAPLVQIDSPKSPPRTLFMRAQSASPERSDTGDTSGLKSTPSQHSSRTSTRAPSPAVHRSETLPSSFIEHSTTATTSTSFARPRSPVPPPVNRAEKPKVPVKPQLPIDITGIELTKKTIPVLNKRSVSPFTTPPGSDDESTPQVHQPDVESMSLHAMRPPPSPRRLPPDTSQAVAQSEPQSSTDPRFMGFSAPRSTTEKKDARTLGLSSSPVPVPLTRETRPSSSSRPQQPEALVIRTSRDPRSLGFSAAEVEKEEVTETSQKPRRPSRQELPATTTTPTPSRDARMFGFSNSTSAASTPTDNIRPELPQRQTPKLAPPRPSVESKRPVYQPGIARTTVAKIPSQAPPLTQNRRPSEVPRQEVISTSEVNFPPPPKRNTFGGGGDDDSHSVQQNSDMPLPLSGSRRQSLDHRTVNAEDSDDMEDTREETITARHEYPDATQTNRRPPISNAKLWRIDGRTDGKVFDICGKYLCTAGYHTRIFDLESGHVLLDINHGEAIKATAVVFKPGASIESEGKRLWLGNTNGDVQEIDIETQSVVTQTSAHNRRCITNMFRHQKDVWTVDDAGTICVWPSDESGVPNMKYSHATQRLVRPPTFAMIVHDYLWVATGKEVRVYRPGRDSNFVVTRDPLIQSGNGDVTCGSYSDEGGGRVYLGHADGKVSIYSTRDLSCLGNVKISDYKINGMVFVEDKLWAVFKTGKVYVYNTSTTPWTVVKDWRAHDGPAAGIALDYSGVWTLGRLQVVTTGHEGLVKLWDGWLEDDSIDDRMHQREADFCTFRSVKATVTTWNAGATNPALLRTDFLADAIHAEDPDPPEILVFGFQEVVDLEDKSVTAKSILGFGKKKDASRAADQHYQSRVYRDWRDYLARSIAKYAPHHQYIELHTSSLIGLFYCVFVRQDERANVRSHAMGNVKCGMSGHYGNKGALLCRFVLDDSSICFLNCHLAAGQSHTPQRNNDVAKILEAEALPSEASLDARALLYIGGGDGAQILDHEICILNGDLNYRIDAIPRNTVIKMINNNELSKLLERDQIYVSRRRVSGFRLAPFREELITFAPTYKYDVGSDKYDSSDKKRSPAWCDRILYRGTAGRVKQLEYRRHDGVRYSDHRPVSGLFRLKVKRVDQTRRGKIYEEVVREFDKTKRKRAQQGCVNYLVEYFGIEEKEARKLIIGNG